MLTKADQDIVNSDYANLTAAINKDGKAIAQKLRTKRANEKEFISNMNKVDKFLLIAFENLVVIEDIQEEMGIPEKREILIGDMMCKIKDNGIEVEYKNGTAIIFKILSGPKED
ncbi:MAG TPA: hypothetical protein ENI76_05810 [Ignavibacteria bacterium]|nr:hypothetical protein [Ignavibacteria bacterium]